MDHAQSSAKQRSKDTPAGSLTQAIEYLTQAWFPVNPAHYKEFQSKLNSGHYDRNIDAFIKDLKQDFALFTYTLRMLDKLSDGPVDGDPITALRRINLEKARSLFKGDHRKISPHRFEEMKEAQELRFKHSLISCGTAEGLAEKTDLDPDSVFSCALMRQLGLHLIAWNYPRIYSKALQSLSPKNPNLESILSRTLGFSPTALGMKITLNWNLPDDFKAALGLSPSGEEQLKDPSSNIMSRLCQIGEALAKVSDKKHYPDTANEIKFIQKEIGETVGADGLAIIREKLEAASSAFPNLPATASPAAEADEDPAAHSRASALGAQELFSRNQHIKKCPEHLQKQFAEVYATIRGSEIALDGVGLLMKKVAPWAGFNGGAIFLYDPNETALVPRLASGTVPLQRFKPLSCSAYHRVCSPLVDAFHSRIPIKERDTMLHGVKVSYIAGALKEGEKVGVLYLEISEQLLEGESHLSTLYFMAIRQALCDCLGVAT